MAEQSASSSVNSELTPQEINMEKLVCRFYAKQECVEGDNCLFPHVEMEGRIVDSACRDFLKNECKSGVLCQLDHVRVTVRNGEKVVQLIQAQFQERKRKLEQHYRLEAQTWMNSFVKGYDMDTLVCRFYAKGECEAGDKCLFPHVGMEGRTPDTACRFFIRKTCQFGKYCRFDHVLMFIEDGKKVLKMIHPQIKERGRHKLEIAQRRVEQWQRRLMQSVNSENE